MTKRHYWIPRFTERFVRESNAIEGICREPFEEEIRATDELLALDTVKLDDVKSYVYFMANAHIRDVEGMNVWVGDHTPPPGGPHIVQELEKLLDALDDKRLDIYQWHVDYETLHPFMDGNGRSGRVLWAWWMQRFCPNWLETLNFLHAWYYQSLSASRKKQPKRKYKGK